MDAAAFEARVLALVPTVQSFIREFGTGSADVVVEARYDDFIIVVGFKAAPEGDDVDA